MLDQFLSLENWEDYRDHLPPIPMSTLNKVQLRSIILMGKTLKIIQNLLVNVSQEDATTFRDPNDGEKGWTIVEVLCHLRDFETVMRERADMMQNKEHPHFPMWDHEVLVQEHAYNQQNLQEVLKGLAKSRKALQEYFTTLPADKWERTALHPEYGEYTVTDLAMQVGTHDVTHLEQITQILLTIRNGS